MEFRYRVATATVGTQELDDAAAIMLNRLVRRGYVVDKFGLIHNPKDGKTLVAHYLLIPIAAEHIEPTIEYDE